ncbi:Clp protease [Fragilaria crotonensis]|nr:Clp protease [Fragilaria crotonensis]
MIRWHPRHHPLTNNIHYSLHQLPRRLRQCRTCHLRYDAIHPLRRSDCLFWHGGEYGRLLLGAGAPGKRKSLPNARIMIHQPLGGAQGAAADIEIQAKEILFVNACLNKYMAEYQNCVQPEEKIAEDTDRDFFMTPYEALDYGLIDEVIKTKTSHIPTPKMPMIQL